MKFLCDVFFVTDEDYQIARKEARTSGRMIAQGRRRLKPVSPYSRAIEKWCLVIMLAGLPFVC